MHLIACDGGGELRLCLRVRRLHSGGIDIAALAARRVERDVLKAFAYRRCSQTFGNFHLA